MTTDRYTRVVLAVIAASLAVEAGSKLLFVPPAFAAQSMKCEIDGTVKVEGTVQIDTFTRPLSVKAAETIPIKEQKY